MRTDKKMLIKGVKFLGYTTLLMFSAPVAIYQAFKNQGHPLYWPVLIVGLILGVAAIAMGFYSIKILLDSLFGKNEK